MGPRAGGVDSHPPIERSGAAPRARTVCHLIASNFAGGPEKQIVELSVRLRGLGWVVSVGSFRENRPSVDVIERARARGLETFLIDTRSAFSPRAVGQLVRFLKAAGVEILVTHGYKSDLIGYLARRRAGVLQLPMVRGYTAESRRVRAYERLDRWLLRRFAHVLCVSDATRDLLSRHGIAREKVHVVHNSVDCDNGVVPADLAAEFGLPRGAKVLVAAGRLSAEKGHRYLVEAMRLLDGEDPRVCLVILGSGHAAPELRRQIEAAGLTERVVLAGFVADVPRYLAGADLVVNPSLTEGLPNVVLEALSVGAPVVATDVGGVSELVIPGRTGWLVPARDARALAGAIASALSDRPRASDFGKRGYQWVSDSFSFAQQAARFSELCAGLLNGAWGES
jgi:glycosyltransferase involved in cell wall biosynthesis